tara:strand:- start:88 stop:585 length:498 start_codon:yes stop_codon:yes gene_type:complete
MGRFIGFANCKNCSKGFRKKAVGSIYCSDHCKNEFNARKSSNKTSNVEKSVWTLVESGAISLDEIAERLNISVTAAARIVGSSGEDLQEWYKKHHPKCKKCGKRPSLPHDFCTEDCNCAGCEQVAKRKQIDEELQRIQNSGGEGAEEARIEYMRNQKPCLPKNSS